MRLISYQFKVQSGFPDATVSPIGYEEFGCWLTGDLQGSIDYFDNIKNAIKEIRHGNSDLEEFDGNGMLLTLTNSGAVVQSLLAFDDDPSINQETYPPSEPIDLDTFEVMIEEWLEYRQKCIEPKSEKQITR